MSAKKAAKATATALFDTADRPEKIRNVALVGHSGGGKTTLVEALLVATGTIGRAGTIADGTTTSDHDPVEVSQQRSVGLSVCPLRWDNVVVNLLDTPGYPDFTGELRAGLRAADAALFVVSAADDIDPITVSLWEECAALGTPRAVVVTKLDVPRTSFASTVADWQRVFGGADGQDALPLYLTVGGAGEGVPDALVGLLTRTVYDYRPVSRPRSRRSMNRRRSTATSTPRGPPSSRRSSTTPRTRRCSTATSPVRRSGLDVLIDDLETAVARGTFYPVLPVCATTGLGLGELLEVLSGAFPSPVELDPPETMPLYGPRAPG